MAAVFLVCVCAETAGHVRRDTSALAKPRVPDRIAPPLSDSIRRRPWPVQCEPCTLEMFCHFRAVAVALRQRASFLSLMLPALRLCLAPAPLRWSVSLASLSLLASLSRSRCVTLQLCGYFSLCDAHFLHTVSPRLHASSDAARLAFRSSDYSSGVLSTPKYGCSLSTRYLDLPDIKTNRRTSEAS